MASKKHKDISQSDLEDALRQLLLGHQATTQEEICGQLESLGFEINQSKASRLLRKIGAVKVLNREGQTVYSLPQEPAPPLMSTSLENLIVDIVANETLVVVLTSPGSASMVARVLDYSKTYSEILGTIAGDDTIFVVPKSVKHTHQLAQEIKNLLSR
jgi:transcriptional regulator of arginine metabolism